MKKHILTAIIMATIFILTSCEESHVVSSRPSPPVYERPLSPGIDYIWIDGDWRYRRHNYVWHEGYWRAPRPSRTWYGGNWHQRGNGWTWHRGRWH